ncbi:sulfotransferase family protein [Palleronia aestuarii]|uniref:Sulfotransferase family protein n=1 Tax=Palleronia aestuarii TaxID=568105 RepID=A0A2W7NSG6_9RHOB|nr:sulfotransferase [Palleronia aestuarii]PZX16226.1 sulfotransferase family protein [Palleronia aestuarii]
MTVRRTTFPEAAITQRYVFVGGLHRSGTSLLATLLATHPDIACIHGAPVPENEGVYLQGAIPHTALHGRPMHFATDPAQHHVEGEAHDRLETRDRLRSDWDPWFTPGGLWRVEKSPVNLTRMRLYQQLFPTSQFVVILRHPQAVAGAVRKWNHEDLDASIDHWIAAHEQVRGDLAYLHAVLVLRYEDLLARPAATIQALEAFLSLSPGIDAAQIDGHQASYLAERPLSAAQARASGGWGYTDGLGVSDWPGYLSHPLRAVRDAVETALRGAPPGA